MKDNEEDTLTEEKRPESGGVARETKKGGKKQRQKYQATIKPASTHAS